MADVEKRIQYLKRHNRTIETEKLCFRKTEFNKTNNYEYRRKRSSYTKVGGKEKFVVEH